MYNLDEIQHSKYKETSDFRHSIITTLQVTSNELPPHVVVYAK
jgi:hypothetical protein